MRKLISGLKKINNKKEKSRAEVARVFLISVEELLLGGAEVIVRAVLFGALVALPSYPA